MKVAQNNECRENPKYDLPLALDLGGLRVAGQPAALQPVVFKPRTAMHLGFELPY